MARHKIPQSRCWLSGHEEVRHLRAHDITGHIVP